MCPKGRKELGGSATQARACMLDVELLKFGLADGFGFRPFGL